MKPPDEAQPDDDPDRHDGQIRFTGEGLPEGQHDEGDGQYAEDEQDQFGPIEASRWLWLWGHLRQTFPVARRPQFQPF